MTFRVLIADSLAAEGIDARGGVAIVHVAHAAGVVMDDAERAVIHADVARDAVALRCDVDRQRL